jgi:hypothetical protein
MKNPKLRFHPAVALFGRIPMWLSTAMMTFMVFHVIATVGAIVWMAVR